MCWQKLNGCNIVEPFHNIQQNGQVYELYNVVQGMAQQCSTCTTQISVEKKQDTTKTSTHDDEGLVKGR